MIQIIIGDGATAEDLDLAFERLIAALVRKKIALPRNPPKVWRKAKRKAEHDRCDHVENVANDIFHDSADTINGHVITFHYELSDKLGTNPRITSKQLAKLAKQVGDFEIDVMPQTHWEEPDNPDISFNPYAKLQLIINHK